MCTLSDLHSGSVVCKMTCHKKCVHKIQSYCSYTGRRKVSMPKLGTFSQTSGECQEGLWPLVPVQDRWPLLVLRVQPGS